MDDLHDKVRELLGEVLIDVDGRNIRLDERIVEDLGAQSLDIWDMIAVLEEEFDLEVSDEDLAAISTVGDVVSFIRVTKGLNLGPDDLLSAVKFGKLPSVEQILASGKGVNPSDLASRIAVIEASGNGHIEMVRLFALNGSDVNAQDNNGRHAMIAAVHGGLEVTEYLLSAGANASVCNSTGWTPLMAACTRWNEKLARLLLENGADAKAKDSAGLTALMHCFPVSPLFQPTLGFVSPNPRYLLPGASSSLEDCTWLSRGNSEGRLGLFSLVDLLMQHGADPNDSEPHGCTALMLAARGIICRTGLPDPKYELEREALLDLHGVVGLLLDSGADPNRSDHCGRTALMHACAGGHVHTVKQLLERGASVNVCDRDGMTALHWAAQGVSLAIGGLMASKAMIYGTVEFEFPNVALLLPEHGADVSLRNQNGQTAIDIAQAHRRIETVARLRFWVQR